MRSIYCITTGEIVHFYKDYLNTIHWKNIRLEAYKKYGKECNKCKNKNNLQVHHKTYERIGNEKLEDLVILCSKCHKFEHYIIDNKDEFEKDIIKVKRVEIKTEKQLDLERRSKIKNKRSKKAKRAAKRAANKNKTNKYGL